MQTALKPLDGCKKYIRPEISSGIVRQKKYTLSSQHLVLRIMPIPSIGRARLRDAAHL